MRRPNFTRPSFSVSALLISAFVLALYTPTLGLLLFSDDAPHMQWLAANSGGAYWLTSEGFPLYRPAAFAVWEGLIALAGGRSPLALHALSLILHLANAVLVAVLARRLTDHPRAALLAGLLFAAFPFSYGAVALAAAQFHLWQTAGLLASALLLLAWLEKPKVQSPHPESHPHLSERDSPSPNRRGGRGVRYSYLILGWAAALWGIFHHENGVLAPLLVGLILLTGAAREGLRAALRDWHQLALALGPVALFSLVYFILRSVVPGSRGAALEAAAITARIAQTMQALGYPFAALFRLIFDPADGQPLAWASGLLAAALLVAWIVRARPDPRSNLAAKLAALGAIWIPLVMLPSWLFLPTDYLLGNARLHYTASAGIAWAWAAALTRPLPRRADRLRQTLVGGILAAILLALGAYFIQARVADFRALDRIYREVGGIASDIVSRDPDRSPDFLLVLNGPSSFVPERMTFLLGSEGSVYLPEYVSLETFLWLNNFISEERPLEVEMRAAPDVSPAFPVDAPALDRAAVRNFGIVAAVIPLQNSYRAVVVGQQIPDVARQPLARWEGGIALEDAHFFSDGPQAGIRVVLDWRVIAGVSGSPAVFVHLLCDDALIAQADGPPLGRAYPFEWWQVGEGWRDTRTFDLPAGQDTGCLRVQIGLYDPATGARLPAMAADGQITDSVVVVTER